MPTSFTEDDYKDDLTSLSLVIQHIMVHGSCDVCSILKSCLFCIFPLTDSNNIYKSKIAKLFLCAGAKSNLKHNVFVIHLTSFFRMTSDYSESTK